MERRPRRLQIELASAGFSTRTINLLIDDLRLQSVEDLRSAEWGSIRERTGLAATLNGIPKMGPKGWAEVQAFRSSGDARQAVASTKITARLQPDDLARLDVWAIDRGMTRVQAVRAIVV